MAPAMESTTTFETPDAALRRAKTPAKFEARVPTVRPLSEATEMFDIEYDEGSEFEEDYSPKGSFDSQDSRRRSQTTISSYDEAPTPNSSRNSQEPFEAFAPSVKGPTGPHLFRASQVSAEFTFDYALQMSPLLPKQTPLRTETAFSEETVTPVTQPFLEEISIAAALAEPVGGKNDHESQIRMWTPQQVVDWMYTAGVDASIIECFDMHDIDGAVLLDLEFDDLKELGIPSFGKRHQLWSAVCDLRGDGPRASPQPTPFQDISRPCTSNTKRSPSRARNTCETPVDGDATLSPTGDKKRRGRKPLKQLDVITPAESVSIVAIEQLLPKPHKCNKGERCAKWRKQQRELQQLHDENGIGRFPISPTKGGRIFVHGDPGNATTAENIVPNVRRPSEVEDFYRPQSDAMPSVVASSDLLGPGQLPEFALHADILRQLDKRDPQDNVRHFLSLQHMQSPSAHNDDRTPTPPTELTRSYTDPIVRSESVPLFPDYHHQAYPSLHPPQKTPAPHVGLRQLPRLDIPRAATAGPAFKSNTAIPASAVSNGSAICRSITASPSQVYRLGTPASDMDVPITAFPFGTVDRNVSSSVPPNMQFNHPTRSQSRATDRRRPSAALPAVREDEVLNNNNNTTTPRPNLTTRSNSAGTLSTTPTSTPDPSHHSPTTQNFGYGADTSHAGWMKKRKNKMLRHEWHDAHFRLKGTQLGMYQTARLSAALLDNIDVEDYAVACSSVASTSKLGAAMKAFSIRHHDSSSIGGTGGGKKSDPAAFAFQLVPHQHKEGERRLHAMSSGSSGKTHHFAVRNKDERIDWMRELMLAKALRQKGNGFEVEVNGVQA